jgi:hypothetical protein
LGLSLALGLITANTMLLLLLPRSSLVNRISSK